MRRYRWWALAALLLVGAVLLLEAGEPEPRARAAAVEFPVRRDEDVARAERRATLVVPPARPVAPAAAAPAAPRRKDPFLVALPVKPDRPVMVFEANALRHSRLGERFLACIQAQDPSRLADITRETGLDPLKDIDRVAFLGDALVVSGYFDRVRWDTLAGGPAERYGEAGRIFARPGKALGAWGDGILVIADRVEEVRQAIDQLEGRAPTAAAAVPEDMAYGEVYGVIPGAATRRLLGGADAGLAERIASLASRVEVHMDAMQDVAATIRIRGDDAAGLGDLARSLGGALALARTQAQGGGDDRLADLLDHAEVRPGDGELSIHLAVPADKLEAWFQGCERWPTAAALTQGGAKEGAP